MKEYEQSARLVRGVGVNDATYKTQPVINGKREICPFYRKWADMLNRCYSEKELAKRPSYAGCSVAVEWLNFMAFREWMDRQAWKGMHLDKDILVQGNRVYSPNTCIFVTQQLNKFMTDSGAARGEYPIGVEFQKIAGKFRSLCCNPITGKREHLGYFADQDSAHQAWIQRKTQIAKDLSAMQSDDRVRQALLRYDFSKVD